MESPGTSEIRSTGKWYALGGLAGIILLLLLGLPFDYLSLASTLVFVFGLLKWIYEVSTTRARRTGRIRESGQLASVAFVAEVTLLGLFAFGFSAIGLLVIGLGDPAPGVDLETERNLASWGVLAFLVLSLGVLAWAVNRWAFRKRSAYLIPH
jgi:hypothetical protein